MMALSFYEGFNVAKIAIIEDSQATRYLIEDILLEDNHEVSGFPSALKFLELVDKKQSDTIKEIEDYDLIISDVKMPGITGIQLVQELKKKNITTPIVLMTAHANYEDAVKAVKEGAYDYIPKPFGSSNDFKHVISKAISFIKLKAENEILQNAVNNQWSKNGVIGKSLALKKVLDLVDRIASTSATVLITGESGTGKEVIARALHRSSDRKAGPFVAINCSAIPENLLESELFGHAKGSFTGAIKDKRGLFLEADKGTIFLDEIGDLTLPMQVKILRVLQERKIRPVGDNTEYFIDTRIVAATNKDLKKECQEGRFREDLYFRLSVIPLVVPPLRDRKDDIPLLVDFFIKKFATLYRSQVVGIEKDALKALCNNYWKGNIRELENSIERAVILAKNPLIQVEDLWGLDSITINNDTSFFLKQGVEFPTLKEVENKYVKWILEHTENDFEKAAKILDVGTRTIYRRLEALNETVNSSDGQKFLEYGQKDSDLQ